MKTQKSHIFRGLASIFLALLVIFGIVSPKIMTINVSTSVETHAYSSPRSINTKTEAMEDAAMFTRLFPTKMVDRGSS